MKPTSASRRARPRSGGHAHKNAVLALVDRDSGTTPIASSMRGPDKTELEFVILAFVVGVPFAYYAIRTVLALAGL